MFDVVLAAPGGRATAVSFLDRLAAAQEHARADAVAADAELVRLVAAMRAHSATVLTRVRDREAAQARTATRAAAQRLRTAHARMTRELEAAGAR